MSLHGEGIGGVVFLILYLFNFSILLYGFITGRIKFLSVYFWLLFHVVLRIGAQCVSIVLGSSEEIDIGVLIAFYVLGAEGYFSLVLCTYRFLIHHHEFVMPISASWLEGKSKKDKGKQKAPLWTRFVRAMTARDSEGNKDPWVMSIIHWVLIGANAVIISGSSQTNASQLDRDNYQERVNRANIFRAVGQAIFLAINLLLACFLYLTIRQDRNPEGTLPSALSRFFRVSPTHGEPDAQKRGGAYSPPSTIAPVLRLLVIAWPFLIVRGVFGLLQAVVNDVNYTTPNVYRDDVFQFKTYFIVCEMILTVLMEWTACCLLCCTMLTDEGNKKKREAHKARMRSEEDAVESPGTDEGTIVGESHEFEGLTKGPSRGQTKA